MMLWLLFRLGIEGPVPGDDLGFYNSHAGTAGDDGGFYNSHAGDEGGGLGF